MADEEYTKKMESLHQYIPFLDNMIAQLRDPTKKNREQQLSKMESLHAMITDKRKRLKIETLNKCEDVISKLYMKVNHKPLNTLKKITDSPSLSSPMTSIPSPGITPASPSPTREIPETIPLNIPTERVDSDRFIPKVDVYSCAGESLRRKSVDTISPKLPELSKPPISLEDLKQLEEDVHEKITKNASLRELDSLRNKIAHQIIIEDIKSLSSNDKKSKKVPANDDNSNETSDIQKCPLNSTNEIESTDKCNKPKCSQLSLNCKPTKYIKDSVSFANSLSGSDEHLLEGYKKDKIDFFTEKDHKTQKDIGTVQERRQGIDKKDYTDGKTGNEETNNKFKNKFDLSGKKSFKMAENELKSVLINEGKCDENLKEEKYHKMKSFNEIKTEQEDERDLETKFKKDGNKEIHIRSDPRKKGLTQTVKIENKDEKTQLDKNIDNAQPDNTKPVFKRLADKYNPKPKKHVEPEVDKVVSDIIEANMKISPPKIPILNKMPAPTPPPASLIACAQVEPELPQPVQNLSNASTANIINTVISQLRKNQIETEHARQASSFRPPLLSPPHLQSLMSPADPFVSDYSRPTVDTFVSEYVRDHNLMHNRHFEPPDLMKNQFNPTPGRLNFIPPPQTHENFRTPTPYNQTHNSFSQPPMENMHKLDYYPPNAPVSSNQFNCGPPLLSPEIPHYGNEPKPNFIPRSNPHWSVEPSTKTYWDHNVYDNRYRGPTTYREYREMRETRDPRLMRNDLNDSSDSRDNRGINHRDHREFRDPRLNRDPRQNRDLRQIVDVRENRDMRESQEIRDTRENRDPRDSRDKRENRDLHDSTDVKEKRDLRNDRDRFRFNDRVKYDSKFDRLYTRTNRESSPPRLKSKNDSKDLQETFMSPLDSLYTVKEEQKTGKGYGVQNFRIPKLRKEITGKEKNEVESEKLPLEKQEVKVAEKVENTDCTPQDKYTELDTTENNDINETVVCENEELTKNTIHVNKRARKNRRKKAMVLDDDGDNVDEGDQHKSINIDEKIKKDNEELERTLQTEEAIDDQEKEKTSQEKGIIGEHESPKHQLIPDTTIFSAGMDISKSLQEQDTPKVPPEQTILAQFFTNLLSSQDKKEKKCALYSLINTFSDSFSPKELSKITKIIKADDVDSSEEEETKKTLLGENEKTEDIVKVGGESELLITTGKDESVKTTTSKTKARTRRVSSASTSKLEKLTNEVTETFEEVPVEEGVVISVGERIKSHTRSPKPKKKCRTELDMLHEDIQDMFIRDGVLTATGKRMCRLLKDDPNALASSVTTTEKIANEVTQKIRRKPGPKSKTKLTESQTMKNMRVVISKIPETTMEESRRGSRRLTRSMTIVESDEDRLGGSEVNEPETDATPEMDMKDDSLKTNDTDRDSSDTEKDTASQTSECSQKKSTKRKRGKRWASGFINKKKKKEKNISDKYSGINTDVKDACNDTQSVEAEKEYYVDFTAKTYACKLCPFNGRFLTSHYKVTHPDSEILSSKFIPIIASEAIEDAKDNLSKYEASQTNRAVKIHFKCRFCCAETHVVPTIFYDHLSTHTGEYRHKCPHCDFSACGAKTLKVHIKNTHNGSTKPVIRKSYSDVILFGYMCAECHYVQMTEQNVINHVEKNHSEHTIIYKVNMSTVFDPFIEKLLLSAEKTEDSNKLDSTNDDPNNSSREKLETSKVVEEPKTGIDRSVKLQKKTGPKPRSKKRKLSSIQNTSVSVIPANGEISTDINCVETNADHPSEPPVRKRKSALNETLEEEIVIVRGKRAAKEKAQEKLKSLVDSTSVNRISDNADIKQKIPTDEVKDESKSKSTELKTKVKQEIDMNVFTCNTDIHEENKKIELERLQTMEELNKTVGNRTSLNFVDKLCNRLNKNEVRIKEEPQDDAVDCIVPRDINSSPVTMPVLEKNLPIETLSSPLIPKTPPAQSFNKKPVLDTNDQVSKANYDVTQKNDKTIMNMIEKLKGKLGGAGNNSEQDFTVGSSLTLSDNDYDSEGPPPLTHVNELVRAPVLDTSTEILVVGGLIKVIKTLDSITFCCLVPPCVFSTDSQDAFQVHCKIAHKPKAIGRFVSLCETCGMEVKSTVDGNLLENLLKHTLKDHSEFLYINLKDEKKETTSNSTVGFATIPAVSPVVSKLRIRKLSGDALSSTRDPEDEINTNVIKKEPSKSDTSALTIHTEVKTAQLFGSQEVTLEPTSTIAEIELSEDNPFSFKISDVVSLAESQPEVPPLAPLVKSQVTSPLVVKEAKMTQAELAKPRKTQKAMTKFIESVSDLYKCPHYYCLFTTNFRDFLERHLKAHQSEQEIMIPCVYCDLKTPWEHVPMHIDVRHAHCRFACSYCLYRAIAKEYVFLHQDQQHESKDYSVIALPAPKSAKKFAIADPKVDPKLLCEPFRCTHYCQMEFLFLNEFKRHLMNNHKHNNFIMCGYEGCHVRVAVDKMPSHWSQMHGVSLYQCGYCKTSTSELKAMYYHFSKCHQGLMIDILVRMMTPLQNSMTWGYSNEAFKRLRKITSLPNVTEVKHDKAQTEITVPTVSTSNTLTFNNTPALTPIVTMANPVPNVTVAGRTFSLVNTSTPSSAGNILLITTSSTMLSGSQTTVIPPLTSTKLSVINQPTLFSTISASPESSTCLKINENTSNKESVVEVSSATKEISSGCENNIAPVEQILIGESNHLSTVDNSEAEIDPLDISNINENCPSNTLSSEDESDNSKTDIPKNKTGLLGYQLYRCAFCDFSCSNFTDFKKHASKSFHCKSPETVAKPFVCVHCRKRLRNPAALLDHIQTHGILRFMCSLCEEKFPTPNKAKFHMKGRHSISQTVITPLNPNKNVFDTDEFIVKPKFVVSTLPKDTLSVETSPVTTPVENLYMPGDIANIPIRSIFSHDIKCGVCSYSTKVRTNLIRHLQFHNSQEKVPETAPVNPVPCLEKNEKMFDKMINLASSSHTGGRMAGFKETKDKENDNIPTFIPSHSRYACCAQGCNYICPEEANLRHHLIALHDGETSFTCVHCKTNLTPVDADSLLKHFKLHGLQLYKCCYCSFVHNLKHKVEKHINDGHLDLPSKVITVRHYDSEPTQEASTSTHNNIPTKSQKPWRCCMCKTRSQSIDGIKNHVLDKHEIDSQFKCAFCSYKTNEKDTFNKHFTDAHPNQDIDIIYAYRKVEEGPKEDKEIDSFDTTPLWQRDRPRVRHIRGILFDESSPIPAKSPKKPNKNSGNTTHSPSIKITQGTTDVSKSTLNLDLSIESVANGTAEVLRNNESETVEQEENISADLCLESLETDVIVIDDDEDADIIQKTLANNKNISVLKKPVKRKLNSELQGISKMTRTSDSNEIINSDSESKLKNQFGDFGGPLNRQLKCPKCNKFKSKRISDFIFHMYKETKIYRYKCGICSDESITYRYMYSHVKAHNPDNCCKNIISLPSNPSLETWLQILIMRQSSKILKFLSPSPSAAKEMEKCFQCYHCQKWYRTEQERNEHCITHWATIPYSCGVCSKSTFSLEVAEKHFQQSHPNLQMNIVTSGPTISKELRSADELHMNEVRQEIGPNNMLSSEAAFNTAVTEVNISDILEPSIPTVIDNSEYNAVTSNLAGPAQDQLGENNEVDLDVCTVNDRSSNKEYEVENDDLFIVSSMDTNVPKEGDIYCCEYCPVMSNSEMAIISHITGMHEHMHIKFKILNSITCENKKDEFVGCGMCSEVGSEIKIRRHYLEKHSRQAFIPYRYTCTYCDKKFMKLAGAKTHSMRTHTGMPLKISNVFQSVFNTTVKEKVIKEKVKHTNCTLMKYKCPLCSYERIFPPNQIAAVKSHLRMHFRAFVCGSCSTKFRSRHDTVNHFAKEHPGIPENITQDVEIEDELNKTIMKIQSLAEVVSTPNTAKAVARKSTSALHESPEEYTFYGLPREETDLTKISTAVELNGMCLNMSAEKLGKLFDLHPYVHVEDCSKSLDLISYLDS